MQILNETVYDSAGIVKLVDYACDLAYNHRHKECLAAWRRNSHLSTFKGPAKTPAPEQVLVGYYSPSKRVTNPKRKQRRPSGEATFVSCRVNHQHKTMKLGIIRPTQLPLPAMEVVALAMAEKRQRTLPPLVLRQIVWFLLRHFYVWNPEDVIGGGINDEIENCPTIHYDHEPDRESAEQSRLMKRQHKLFRMEQMIAHSIQDIASRETRLAKVRTNLARLEAQVEQLRQQLPQELIRG